MGLKLSELRKRMKVYLNEYNGTGDDDSFGESVDEVLNVHLDSAARIVAMVAPDNMQVAKTEPLSLTWTQRADKMYYGTGTLPSTFLRLELMNVDTLQAPVSTLLSTAHPTYKQQFCTIPGLGAGEYMPKAYQNDGMVMVHASKTSNGTATITYIATPGAKGDDPEYDTLKDELLDIVALQAAALYMSLTGLEGAKSAQDAARAMIEEIERQTIGQLREV